jgi:hypothetical protein
MRGTAGLLVGIALLGGCGGEPTATRTAADVQAQAAVASQAAAKLDVKDLAALRQVTAPFHDFEKAKAAGWSAKITACMTDPGGAGGMGFHYGNPALIDGTVRAREPELLLYEPDEQGVHLVAVEYIVPYTKRGRDDTPPRLFGQPFKHNDAFQIWALHVWAWKDNPSGLFADWNPRVTCAHTTDVAAMAH